MFIYGRNKVFAVAVFINAVVRDFRRSRKNTSIVVIAIIGISKTVAVRIAVEGEQNAFIIRSVAVVVHPIAYFIKLIPLLPNLHLFEGYN